jgi:hypothetical protein
LKERILRIFPSDIHSDRNKEKIIKNEENISGTPLKDQTATKKSYNNLNIEDQALLELESATLHKIIDMESNLPEKIRIKSN